MTTALGIIADDYTGALMVACYLEGIGIYAPLAFSPGAVACISGATVVGTRVRTVDRNVAVLRVGEFADALEECGCSHLVYKPSACFDSMASGNVGAIADFLAERRNVRPVLMAAGFPRYEITTHQGYLFYRGRLVSESVKRFDPLTPMIDPDLVRFLSLQTPHAIGLVDHLRVRKGSDELANIVDTLSADGCGHVFFDVSDDADLETVASYAASTEYVLVASDPVAVAYTRLVVGRTLMPPKAKHAKGPSAVLVGTVGPTIERQLARFAEIAPVLAIDVTDPRHDETVVEEMCDRVSGYIGREFFAVSTGADVRSVNEAQAKLGVIGAARRAENMLAALAKRLHERGVRRLVVAGGETSGAVVDALNVKRARALPENPFGPGFCVTETNDPISLFLKPGKHGSDTVLLDALSAMDA